MPFDKNQVEIWLSSKISLENCYLVRFWQNERVSCKNLTEIVTLENSDRKSDYPALICRKKVSLLDSGRRMVTLQYSGWMKSYLARFWQKSSYLAIFWLIEWLSCKILTKKCLFWRTREKFGYPARFRQKIVILQYSGWMNGYLARFWRKRVF